MQRPYRIVLSTLRTWLIIFSIGMVWESVLRVLLYHESRTLSEAFSYVTWNVVFAIILAIIMGSVHAILLFVFERFGAIGGKLKLLFTPLVGVAIAFFLFAPALSWQIKHHITLKSTTTVGICLVIYFACILLFRYIRTLGVWPPMKTFAVILAILSPLLILCMIHLMKNSDITQSSKGPTSSIILISIDTLRHDYVGAYGSSTAKTPVLDSMAKDGALFQHAITLVGETTPSHISMFVGDYPWPYGVFHNGMALRRNTPTLTRYLRRNGYRTAAFVSGLPVKSSFSGLDQDFGTYDDRFVLKDFFQESFYGRIIAKLRFFVPGYWRLAPETTAPVLRWLDKNAGSPFFLFVHYYDPHFPYGNKPQMTHEIYPFRKLARPEDLATQKQLYAKELELVDAQIGRIKEFLQKKNIYDQTLLIVTADHGESLGEHNYYYDHGDLVYDQILRVPLIIRCPRLIKAGSVIEKQVSLPDLYETILIAAGVAHPKKTHSLNLLPSTNAALMNDDRVFPSDSFFSIGIRTQQWKFIRNKKQRPETFELYDLLNDPGETRNLVRNDQKRATEMKEKMSKIFSSIDANVEGPKFLSEEQLEQLRSLGYTTN